MGISKITRNYQVTLPKDVRELKGLKEGDKVIFAIEGTRIDIVKLDRNIMEAATGIWAKTKKTGAEYEKMVRAGWAKRLGRELK